MTFAQLGQNIFRWAILITAGVFFLVPLISLAEFSTRGADISQRSLAAWSRMSETEGLFESIETSLLLALVTALCVVFLLLPTQIWVYLRLPRVQRVFDFICLLPLTIPPIVLVVGLAPIYRWVDYLLGYHPLNLTFVYVVLALPYAARAHAVGINAVDVRTLAEAAQSLGARWRTIIGRILMPALSGAILNALLLSVALVLGEFTVAELLAYPTAQVKMSELGQADAQVSVGVALLSMVAVFLILVIMTIASRFTRTASRKVRS